MVKLIGMRRLINLSLLIAMNACFLAALLLWAQPLRTDMEDKIRRIDGSMRSLNVAIERIKADVQEVRQNKPYFDKLTEMGFFQKQDRFFIGKQLGTIKDNIDAPSFSYSVRPQETLDNADAEKAKYDLVKSTVFINDIVSYSDKNIFLLLHALNTQFPGQTRIQEFSIAKNASVNDKTLQELKDGKIPALAKGQITFDWLTLVEKPKDIDPTNNYLRN